MDNKEKYDGLEAFRKDEPVLWAILIGKRSVPTIAEHLIMMPSRIQKEIEHLLDEGLVTYGSYMGKSILKIQEPSLQELAKFAYGFRAKYSPNQSQYKKRKKQAH